MNWRAHPFWWGMLTVLADCCFVSRSTKCRCFPPNVTSVWWRTNNIKIHNVTAVLHRFLLRESSQKQPTLRDRVNTTTGTQSTSEESHLGWGCWALVVSGCIILQLQAFTLFCSSTVFKNPREVQAAGSLWSTCSGLSLPEPHQVSDHEDNKHLSIHLSIIS